MRNLKALSVLYVLVSALITLSPVDARAAWTKKVIDGGYVRDTGIAVDSKGYLHISLAQGENLFYLNNTTGKWVKKIIDASEKVGSYTAIAVDKNDKVHISYQKKDPYSLQYAANASGTWVNSTIDRDVAKSAIAVDLAGKVHIIYDDSRHCWVCKYVDFNCSRPCWQGAYQLS